MSLKHWADANMAMVQRALDDEHEERAELILEEMEQERLERLEATSLNLHQSFIRNLVYGITKESRPN